MEGSELPADVVQFIAAQIDTVPQLEALLLFWESAPRTWTADEIAARIYVARDVAVQILQDLERKRLVRTAEGAAERFVYDPAWDATGDFMARVAATYRQNLIRVAQSIHARAPSAVREFARAFEIKKEE